MCFRAFMLSPHARQHLAEGLQGMALLEGERGRGWYVCMIRVYDVCVWSQDICVLMGHGMRVLIGGWVWGDMCV